MTRLTGFDPAEQSAGSLALIKALVAYWEKTPDLEVTLIGHSAGSIYIRELLLAIDTILPQEERYRFNVILLAAAASFSHYQSILDILNRRVKNIRSFALTEAQEHGYWEVPGVYNASLLYLVSGCFEEDEIGMPIIGMARFYQNTARLNRPDIKQIRDLIKDDVLVLAPTPPNAPNGRKSQALKHGPMQTEAETIQSLVHIIEKGFG